MYAQSLYLQVKTNLTPSLKNSFNQSPESLCATSFRVLPLEQLPSLLHTCVLAAEGEGHFQEGIAEEAWSAEESSTFMCIKWQLQILVG